MLIFAGFMKNLMLQQTLNKSCSFEGKGLHTGKVSHMTICPAPANTGIVFVRTDIGQDAEIEALAENVTNTARSTTISKGEVSVVTIEHLLSALTGLGVDNARIEIDNIEVPILDGSARPYVEAILRDGLKTQQEERKFIEIKEEILVEDPEKGVTIKISPAEEPSFECRIDFDSKVMGVQEASWDFGVDYASNIGICRTFVFFHELEFLYANNLIKGGDVDNAIVIVEHPVSDAQIARMCELFGVHDLKVSNGGYLSNVGLHFENECARHKLLDLIGDMRLVGGFMKAKVSAVKSGHRMNTNAAKAVRAQLIK